MLNISKGKLAVVTASLFVLLSAIYGISQFLNSKTPAPLGDIDLSSNDSQISLDAVTEYYLFGDTAEIIEIKEPKPIIVEEKIQVEPINLKVTGILASNVSILAKATLKVDGGKEKTYNIGDKLTQSDSVTLASINQDHVLVDNNGESQRYPLERPPLKSNKIRGERDLGLLANLDELQQTQNFSTDADLYQNIQNNNTDQANNTDQEVEEIYDDGLLSPEELAEELADMAFIENSLAERNKQDIEEGAGDIPDEIDLIETFQFEEITDDSSAN